MARDRVHQNLGRRSKSMRTRLNKPFRNTSRETRLLKRALLAETYDEMIDVQHHVLDFVYSPIGSA